MTLRRLVLVPLTAALGIAASACATRYDILADARASADRGETTVALALYRQGFAEGDAAPVDRVAFGGLLADEASDAFARGDVGRGVALTDELAAIDPPGAILAAAQIAAAEALAASLASPGMVAARLQAARDADPASVDAATLAEAWELAGDNDRAADALQAAWLEQPTDPRRAMAWGNAASRAGRHDEAIAALSQAADSAPEHTALQVALASAQERAGDVDAADATWVRLLASEGEVPGLWLGRAAFLQRSGRPAEAVEARARAQSIAPAVSP